jgi:class 3 adenylate cyclase
MPRTAHQPREILLTLLAIFSRCPLDRTEAIAGLQAHGGGGCPSSKAVEAAIEALLAEGLIERQADALRIVYRTTATGAKTLEDQGEAWTGEQAWPSSRLRLRFPAWAGRKTQIRSFMYTDAVGATALLDRLGDEGAYELRGRHVARLRAAIGTHVGYEVKSLGDGLMVAFQSAHAAVECAVTMQRSAARFGDSMGLRVGIDAGKAMRDGEDYFGRPVIVARRLCDIAHAGQILVSQSAVELIDDPGTHRFEPIGSLALKGLDDPVNASGLRWETATSSPQESLMGARQEKPYPDLLPVAAAP